jgi:hypothetical protein
VRQPTRDSRASARTPPPPPRRTSAAAARARRASRPARAGPPGGLRGAAPSLRLHGSGVEGGLVDDAAAEELRRATMAGGGESGVRAALLADLAL